MSLKVLTVLFEIGSSDGTRQQLVVATQTNMSTPYSQGPFFLYGIGSDNEANLRLHLLLAVPDVANSGNYWRKRVPTVH